MPAHLLVSEPLPALAEARVPDAVQHVRVGAACEGGAEARELRPGVRGVRVRVAEVGHHVVAADLRKERRVDVLVPQRARLAAAVRCAGRRVAPHLEPFGVQVGSQPRHPCGPLLLVLGEALRHRVARAPAVAYDVHRVVPRGGHARGEQRVGDLAHVRVRHGGLAGELVPAVPVHRWVRRDQRGGEGRDVGRGGAGSRRGASHRQQRGGDKTTHGGGGGVPVERP